MGFAAAIWRQANGTVERFILTTGDRTAGWVLCFACFEEMGFTVNIPPHETAHFTAIERRVSPCRCCGA
jgi:hypothetical protein